MGGSTSLTWGHSCGKFDPTIAVTHTLNQIAAGADQMMNTMTNAATAAIAALPALILQRANPGLYDLFQNALLRAEATLELATKSCEQMEAEIAAGKNPYADLITLSKGSDWKLEMGIGGNDVVSAKKSVETSNGSNGVPWIGGKAGGNGQPVLRFTGDIVDGTYAEIYQDVAPLDGLSARYGKFFVTGNHEYMCGVEEWIKEMRKMGFTVLLNDHCIIQHGQSRLLVGGVVDYSASSIYGHVSDPVKLWEMVMGRMLKSYSHINLKAYTARPRRVLICSSQVIPMADSLPWEIG